MKRLVFYILITALVIWLPVQSADVGKLRPVQLVAIRRQGQQVVICTDTGDRGEGVSAEAALAQLHNSTPAIVYLDTAEFFLIEESAKEDARYLAQLLKQDVQVYESRGVQDLELAARYLTVHGGGTPLGLWQQGAAPEILEEEGGRIFLSKKEEKTLDN